MLLLEQEMRRNKAAYSVANYQSTFVLCICVMSLNSSREPQPQTCATFLGILLLCVVLAHPLF